MGHGELSSLDKLLLTQACRLAFSCPPAEKAYAVGCIIASEKGDIIAQAYSRMLNPTEHAEQTAIALAQQEKGEHDLATCTLYSSLQPCAARQSHAYSCQDYIIKAGIKRVVYGMAEPPLFLKHAGDGKLTKHGIMVISDNSLNDLVRQANPHIR